MSTGLNGLEYIFVTIVLCGSAVMIALGLQVRSRGKTPYCGRCGYNLTGLVSNRCPECGTDVSIAANIQHGRPHRRWWLAAIGGVALLTLIAWPFMERLHIDWYPFKPTGWVINDTQSTDYQTAGRAWQEFERRLKASEILDRHYVRLIEIYLNRQTEPASKRYGGRADLYAYVTVAFEKGLFSQAQLGRLLEQMVEASLNVRPRVSPHDQVPAELRIDLSSEVFPVACKFRMENLRLNDQPLDDHIGYSIETFGRQNRSSPIEIGKLPPGRHELIGTLEVEIYEGTVTRGSVILGPVDPDWEERPCYRRDSIPLRATFEVLETEPEDYIRMVRNSKVQDVIDVPSTWMQYSISLARDSDGRCRVTGYASQSVVTAYLPVNMAVDVYLRIEGQEFLLGQGVGRKGERGPTFDLDQQFVYTGPARSGGFGGGKDQPALVLRSNEQVARQTVDLYEIWEGEAINYEAPISWEKDDFGKP